MADSQSAVSEIRASARTWDAVQWFSDKSIESSWVRLILFDVCRFRARPSGFLFLPSCEGFHASVAPLFVLPVSSKHNHLSTGPACARAAASLAISSPTALDRNRRPYHPEIPTSGTVRPQGFSPSRRLTPPATLASLFHPACAPGVPPNPPTRLHLSAGAGCDASGFPLRSFLPSHDDRLVGGLLSCTRQVPRRRGASVISYPVKDTKPPGEYCRVSITKQSVYPEVASQGHQLP